MKFKTSFLLSVHLMAFASFQSLTLTHELPLLFSLFVVGMISASFIFNLKNRKFEVPKAVVNLIILGSFLFFLLDWTLWSKSLLIASAYFLNLLLLIKLFTLNRSRDFIQLFLVSFLQILAASALSFQVSFAFFLLFYLMVATWGMILYQMKAEIEERNRFYGVLEGSPFPDTFESEEVITLPFFLTTLGVGIFSFIVTILIFFIIPRAGGGFLKKGEGGEVRTSGFSEKVDFGSMAPVKLDPTVVMRVFLSAPPPKMYIRGTSFNIYDGMSWKNTLHHQKQLPSGEEILDPLLKRKAKSKQQPDPLAQEYIVEPMDTQVLFAPGRVVRLESPFRNFFMDEMGNLALQYKLGSKINYKISSLIPELSPEDQGMTLPQLPGQRGNQTYTDYSFSDKERVIRLAERATESAHTLYEKAQAIEGFLKGNYAYSLSVAPSKDHSPMEDFLFYQRKGYCEHFATAMVLMLRSLGIPSRLVTGYSPEEWNPYGSYFKVRQSDAHAWVEVFFPHSGWLTFDPTPPEPVNSAEASFSARMKEVFLPLDQLMDAVKLKWDRYFIHYSIQDQLEMAHEVQKKGILAGELFKTRMDALIDGLSGFKKTGEVLFGFLMILIFLRIMAKGLPERIQGYFRKTDPCMDLYAGLLKILEHYHLHKNPHQTPFEFLRESSDFLRQVGPPFYDGAKWITDLYYRLRFGGEEMSAEDQIKVGEVLEILKRYSPTLR